MKADQVPIPLDEHNGRCDNRSGLEHLRGPLEMAAVMVDADEIWIANLIVVLADPIEGGRFVEEWIV